MGDARAALLCLIALAAFSAGLVISACSNDTDDDDDDSADDDVQDDDAVDDDDDSVDDDDDTDDDDDAERELLWDDGTAEAHIGCKAGQTCHFGNAFDPQGPTNLLRVRIMFSSLPFAGSPPDAPYPCTLKIYSGTVAGGPSGDPLATQQILPAAFDAWEEFALDAPLAVAGEFVVACNQTVGYQSLAMDSSTNSGSWVSIDGVNWEPPLLREYPGTMLLRAIVAP